MWSFWETSTQERNCWYIYIFTRQQVGNDTLKQYVTELKLLGSNCNFSGVHDSLPIRDRTICGIRNDELRARLLREMTLGKCLQFCRAAEFSKEKMQCSTNLGPKIYTEFGNWISKWVVRLPFSASTVGNFMRLTRISVQRMARNATEARRRFTLQFFAIHHYLNQQRRAEASCKKWVHAVDAEDEMQDFFVGVIKSSESTDYWFVYLKFGSKKGI